MSDEKTAKLLTLLGNPIRVNIVKLVYAESRSFSDLMKHLSLESTSKLSFHLEKLDELVTKNKVGTYELTEMGERAYFLLKTIEHNEIISPVPEIDEKFTQKATFFRNPAPILLSLTIFLVIVIPLIFMLISLIASGNNSIELFRYSLLLIPFLYFAIYMVIAYRMNLSFEYSVFGVFIGLIFLLSDTMFSFFGIGPFLLGAVFTSVAPTAIEAIPMFFFWIGSFIGLVFLCQYSSEYFNLRWSFNPRDYSFDGPKWLLFFRRKRLWAILIAAYFVLGLLSDIFVNEYIIYSEFEMTLITHGYGAESHVSRNIFPIYLHRFTEIIPIIIITGCIYFLYKSENINSKVKLLGSLFLIALPSANTWISGILKYLKDPSMDVTRTVPGMELMPELFLLSEILTGIIQGVVVIGLTLLLLIFIYRGNSMTIEQMNSQYTK